MSAAAEEEGCCGCWLEGEEEIWLLVMIVVIGSSSAEQSQITHSSSGV